MNIDLIGKLALVWAFIVIIVTVMASIADYKRLFTHHKEEKETDE